MLSYDGLLLQNSRLRSNQTSRAESQPHDFNRSLYKDGASALKSLRNVQTILCVAFGAFDRYYISWQDTNSEFHQGTIPPSKIDFYDLILLARQTVKMFRNNYKSGCFLQVAQLDTCHHSKFRSARTMNFSPPIPSARYPVGIQIHEENQNPSQS
jgi:hypothetical protein